MNQFFNRGEIRPEEVCVRVYVSTSGTTALDKERERECVCMVAFTVCQ